MRNKKAVSNLVSAVFLILVGIVSVSIIYVSINNFATRLSPEISCTELGITLPITLDNVCFNTETGEVEATLSRKISSNQDIFLLGFKVYSSEGESEWECGGNCPGSYILSPGESTVYYLEDPVENPSTLVLSINGCSIESKEIFTC